MTFRHRAKSAFATATGIIIALTPGHAQSGAPWSDSAIVRRVNDHYNHLRSLRSRYTERYIGVGTNRTETGTLLLKKPGKMRWIYDRPPGKVFVLDGKFGWSYAPGDAQVQRVSAKRLDDLRSPLRLLLGHTQLQSELESLRVTGEKNGFRITGMPRGMGQRVKELSLEVDSSGQIQSIQIEEIDGSTTLFSFKDNEENVSFPTAEFDFTPPPGVTIVDGLPPA